MWLIDRHSDGLSKARIPLPGPLRKALVRWYAGEGSRPDEEAGIMLVQQAHIGEKWLACDCLGSDREPPMLTPAFLSEAETYYLRRLTGSKLAQPHQRSPQSRNTGRPARRLLRGPAARSREACSTAGRGEQ